MRTVLPSGAPNTIAYDPNGNLLLESSGGQLTSYTWDIESRLLAAAYPSGPAFDTFTCLADGKRMRKELASGDVSNAVWDGQNVLQDLFVSGSPAGRYTVATPGSWGSGADMLSQHKGGATSFYIGDAASSIRALVSSAPAITDSYLLKAFGEELLVTGTSNNVLRAFGMFGYQRDAASRLWVRARALDVVKGRWVSRDPIGFGFRSWNLYLYVRNRTPRLVDPSGWEDDECTGAREDKCDELCKKLKSEVSSCKQRCLVWGLCCRMTSCKCVLCLPEAIVDSCLSSPGHHVPNMGVCWDNACAGCCKGQDDSETGCSQTCYSAVSAAYCARFPGEC